MYEKSLPIVGYLCIFVGGEDLNEKEKRTKNFKHRGSVDVWNLWRVFTKNRHISSSQPDPLAMLSQLTRWGTSRKN